MKKVLMLVPLLLLSGCLATNPPVIPKWPDVPKDLLEACPDLKTVDAKNQQLSSIVEVVADNYKEYYQCKGKVDDWIEWYKSQKNIWQTLK